MATYSGQGLKINSVNKYTGTLLASATSSTLQTIAAGCFAYVWAGETVSAQAAALIDGAVAITAQGAPALAVAGNAIKVRNLSSSGSITYHCTVVEFINNG